MSYQVEQKVGNKIYVYEATSYWDKKKQQSRQKRVFLGRKDAETGQIIQTKYSARSVDIKSVTELGPTYVVKELMTQIGLKGCIDRTFGSKSQSITSLIQYMLLESGPYYLQEYWAERSGELPICSQNISQLLRELGESSGAQDDFFREWNSLLGHQKAVYMDITSLSSYGQNIEFLEWGYNRDGEPLEQLNLGLLIGGTSGLPMMYRIYPGSIPDVATLEKTLEIGKLQYGLDADQLVMDRGFYSQHNIKEMIHQGHKFVIPVPLSLATARELLTQSKSALNSPIEAFSYESDAYFYHQSTFQLKDISLSAHIYLNDARRSKEVRTFLRRLDDLEAALSEQTFFNLVAAEEFLNEQMAFSSQLFELSYQDGKIEAKRRRNVLSRRMNRFGKIIVITNDHSLNKKDILHHYRQKDCVEKYYDILKNSLNQSRLRVHSQYTAEGHLFMSFLTAIVYMALSARMKQADLFRSLSVPELFSKLKTIRSVTIEDGPAVITEIPKNLRTTLQKLNIPLPQ